MPDFLVEKKKSGEYLAAKVVSKKALIFRKKQ
jgi:hypothetical protein